MDFAVPNFETGDKWTRKLNERFLLDTRLWSLNGILRYSEGVRFATQMLAQASDRKIFVQIATILAFDVIQRGWINRIHSIWWRDIAELARLQWELN